MDKAEKCLERRNNKRKIYYRTEKGYNLVNQAQEMITRERCVVLDEKQILIPGCEIWFTDGEVIDAFATKENETYYMFINKAIIEEQKEYLEKLNWKFLIDSGIKEEYIDSFIEYGLYFVIFHEYAHILCGHVEANLEDHEDKKAEECEADMFSMDYLINFLLHTKESIEWSSEIEKLFLAIYFMMENSQANEYREFYNDKLIQNYYDPERIEKRDHPLNAQRIIYLYEMLNILIVDEKVQLLPIREGIINKLKIVKNISENRDSNVKNYNVINDSIRQLKQSLINIRKKIPRLTD
ncbi:Peptidase U49 [Dorea longicatena]|nr:Peptidase U49 [Dorea longicatena]